MHHAEAEAMSVKCNLDAKAVEPKFVVVVVPETAIAIADAARSTCLW